LLHGWLRQWCHGNLAVLLTTGLYRLLCHRREVREATSKRLLVLVERLELCPGEALSTALFAHVVEKLLPGAIVKACH
jgi:hypothetical protein